MDHSPLAEGLSTGSPPATWKEDPLLSFLSGQ